jgi:hypothetical protein
MYQKYLDEHEQISETITYPKNILSIQIES